MKFWKLNSVKRFLRAEIQRTELKSLVSSWLLERPRSLTSVKHFSIFSLLIAGTLSRPMSVNAEAAQLLKEENRFYLCYADVPKSSDGRLKGVYVEYLPQSPVKPRMVVVAVVKDFLGRQWEEALGIPSHLTGSSFNNEELAALRLLQNYHTLAGERPARALPNGDPDSSLKKGWDESLTPAEILKQPHYMRESSSVLLTNQSSAYFRRTSFNQIGGFDEEHFNNLSEAAQAISLHFQSRGLFVFPQYLLQMSPKSFRAQLYIRSTTNAHGNLPSHRELPFYPLNCNSVDPDEEASPEERQAFYVDQLHEQEPEVEMPDIQLSTSWTQEQGHDSDSSSKVQRRLIGIEPEQDNRGQGDSLLLSKLGGAVGALSASGVLTYGGKKIVKVLRKHLASRLKKQMSPAVAAGVSAPLIADETPGAEKDQK